MSFSNFSTTGSKSGSSRAFCPCPCLRKRERPGSLPERHIEADQKARDRESVAGVVEVHAVIGNGFKVAKETEEGNEVEQIEERGLAIGRHRSEDFAVLAHVFVV